LIVGRILKAHGVRGEVVVASESDNPTRFTRGAVLGTPEGSKLVVRASRQHGASLIVSFEGIDDRTSAEELRGKLLSIEPEARRALEPGEYWPDDLIGLQVQDQEGTPLGEIIDVVVGVQDRLVVQTSSGTVDVPFVHSLVPHVDITGGLVTVNPIPGLFN
jgi:16S rRNA processing protein RimM